MAETKTLRSLSELTADLKLYVPKLRGIPQLDASNMEEMVAQKREVCHQIQEDVANGLKYLSDVQRLLESQTDRMGKRIVESETKEGVSEVEEYLDGVLLVEDPIYLQCAVLAYIKSALSQEFADCMQAHAALHGLEARGILVKEDNGPVKVGYQRFALSDKFGFDPEDIVEINKVAGKFSRRIMVLERQDRQEKRKKATEEADIELSEALEGGNGLCLIGIPPESYETNDGQEAWRGGGNMLVRFTDKAVIPVQGIGSIQRVVEMMVNLGTTISRDSLGQDTPPDFQSTRRRIMSTMDMKYDDAVAMTKKVQAFWHLIQRGVRACQSQEAMAKIREELQKKADISADDFFGLNGSEKPRHGVACLCFEGVFQQRVRQERLYNLFFLAERGTNGDKEVVVITEVPEHLRETLGEFIGKEFPTEGNFSHCPGQLRRMLRGIRSQLDMAHEVAKG